MNTFIKTSVLVALTASLVCTGAVNAEEGGSGHYMPGSMASFIDSVPTSPVILMRLNVINYEGSAAPKLTLPVAGLLCSDLDAKVTGYGLTFLWRPTFIDLGEGWSYAMSTTIPLITSKVSASAATSRIPGRQIALDDDETGLGDIILMPAMISRIFTPDFKVNSRLAIYAPTGKYTVGELANTSKNFWTFSPTLELMYFGQKNGFEASLFSGFDFNTENPDTEYQSGTQFHLESTLAQHFPLWGGLAGVGASGYYYQQLTGDSGEGASFGDFEAKSTGAGPVASYTKKIGDHSYTGELKWLHEFDTEKRLEGDTIFFKFVYTF